MEIQSSGAPDSSPFHLPMLRESIDHFLLARKNGSTDFSSFSSIFSRLLQTLPDPHLEIIWFYAAVTHHCSYDPSGDPLGQVSRLKELFQLLVSCSGSGSPAKRVAVLAPVFYELYSIAVDRRNLWKEVESLMEVMVGYVSLCCSEDMEEEGDCEGLSSCFEDLIRVWVFSKFGKDVGGFFPVISDGVRESIRGSRRVDFVAGVVMFEALLLRLCLKFDNWVLRADLERDVHEWVARTISGFRSFHFLDILLRMLLEPVLPVSSLLKFKDEILLREVLYDAVVTMEYPFISHQLGRNLCGKQLKNFTVMLLLVAETAIRFLRENGDNNKIHAYGNALSKSHLPSQLLKWATEQTVAGEVTGMPMNFSPVALIKWLLIVEDHGVKVFDNNFQKLHAKAVVCKSRGEYELPVFGFNTGEHIDDGFSLNHNLNHQTKGDEEMVSFDSANPPLVFPTNPTNQPACQDTRKRKDGRKDETEVPGKFIKFQLHENATRCRLFPLSNEENRFDVDKPMYYSDISDMEH